MSEPKKTYLVKTGLPIEDISPLARFPKTAQLLAGALINMASQATNLRVISDALCKEYGANRLSELLETLAEATEERIGCFQDHSPRALKKLVEILIEKTKDKIPMKQ
jgi:hypothetical protein